MNMLLVGAGAVGEFILRILQVQDRYGIWLHKAVVADSYLERAKEVVGRLRRDERFLPEQVDGRDTEAVVELIKKHECELVIDGAAPFAYNNLFDAAFQAGADYASMGAWSKPLDRPVYGFGLENSFSEAMASYNFGKHEEWAEAGRMACICMGIAPGAVNVFAKFAALYLFDKLHEVHVKDGDNLKDPGADPDAIAFGSNEWAVLDRCMNPSVEWDKEKGGFFTEGPFAGRETFEMPGGVGRNTLMKVEHEETVTMPRYLEEYGLKKCSFKTAMDDSLVNALKVIYALGLGSLEPVDVNGVPVIPRDLVAAAAPGPNDMWKNMFGYRCVGVHCIGVKDGMNREVFIYQSLGNQVSRDKWGIQPKVAQAGFDAAMGIELIAKGVWRDAGVFSPEHFDPIPYLQLLYETNVGYGVVEMESRYKAAADKKAMERIFAEAGK